MTDRLAELERRLDRLEERIRRAEERFSPEAPPLAPEPPAAAAAAPAVLSGAGSFVSVLGRTLFVLGGAFLIRALTESGAVSRGAGVAFGLSYGILWLALAFRRSGSASGAAFHGITGIAIAFPLIWEATARLSVFPPRGAIAAAVAVTALAGAAAVRQAGSALAATATAASVALFAALAPATGRLDLAAAALVALAAAAEILAYARKWPGPRWVAAAAADLAVVALAAVVSREGGIPEAWRAVSPPLSLAIAIALPLSTIAVFGVRLVSRRRAATAFEAIQSGAALLAGFGGALAIARSGVGGEPAIAAAALGSAAAFYAVAFRFFSGEVPANFHLAASLGLLMSLFGAAVALPPLPRALVWGAAAAVFAAGRGPHRDALAAHGAVLLLASGSCGLAGAAAAAFLLPPAAPPAVSAAALAGFAAGVAAAGVGFRGAAPAGPIGRISRLVAAAVAAAGAGAVVLALLARIPTAVPPARGVPIERMAVLAASSVLIAAAARGRRRDLRFLVSPILAAGGAKLLFDDLPHGTPATRFAALALYGAALFSVPRLLRPETAPTE